MINPFPVLVVLVAVLFGYIAVKTGVPFSTLVDSAQTAVVCVIGAAALLWFSQFKFTAIVGAITVYWSIEGQKLLIAKANADDYLGKIPYSHSSQLNIPWYATTTVDWLLIAVLVILTMVAFRKEQ